MVFLDALARIGKIPNQEEIGSKVSVGREVTVGDRKRIDILIQSESHVILIENKIRGRIDNPLGEYAAHLDSLEPAGVYRCRVPGVSGHSPEPGS